MLNINCSHDIYINYVVTISKPSIIFLKGCSNLSLCEVVNSFLIATLGDQYWLVFNYGSVIIWRINEDISHMSIILKANNEWCLAIKWERLSDVSDLNTYVCTINFVILLNLLQILMNVLVTLMDVNTTVITLLVVLSALAILDMS